MAPPHCRSCWAWACGMMLLVCTLLQQLGGGEALSLGYYDKRCPRVEAAVKQAMAKDQSVPAALFHMHFHDCFVRGCDGFVLLDSAGSVTSEKDGPPNTSLQAFYVIDNAKQAIEALCPGVVSCADILALTARDAITLSGGPSWSVPVGQRDGRVSLANETTALPRPTASFDQLKQAFHGRGLSTKDLVVLSGGHTLGFVHCSSFQNCIRGFGRRLDGVDPALNPSFAAALRRSCPANNTARAAGSAMTQRRRPSTTSTTGCCSLGGASSPPTRRC